MRAPYIRPKYRQQMRFLPAPSAILAQTFFSNEDLVDLVATFCPQTSLAVLMRVSWACFNMCRRRLWEVTPTIFHVLILLPFLELREGHWTLEANRTPPPWEWARFDLYAPYIRQFISLGCSSVLGQPDIDSNIIFHLTFSRPDVFFDSPIFPPLQVLSISSDDFGNSPPCSIEHLCTNRLQDVEIQAKYSLIQPYIQDLATCAKHVKCLTIVGRYTAGTFISLREFKELKKLAIGTWQPNDADNRKLATYFPDYLESLSNRNKLIHLVVRANVSRALSPHSLRHIHHIEIQAGSASIINVLSAGSFRSVVLRFTQAELISTYTECFAALSDSSGQVLASLAVHSHAYTKHDFPLFPCLEPLLNASYIQELCVYHSDRLNMKLIDDDIARMVAAWPRLSQLSIQSSPSTAAGRNIRQQPTFTGMIYLSKLPSLWSISIRVENIALDIQFPICTNQIPNFDVFPSALRHHLIWMSSRNRVKDTGK